MNYNIGEKCCGRESKPSFGISGTWGGSWYPFNERRHADLCPVCNGRGKIRDSKYGESSVSELNEKTCHGCDGKGWVRV